MEASKTCSDVPTDTHNNSSTPHKNELSEVLQSEVAMAEVQSEELQAISNQKNVTIIQGDGESNSPVEVGESFVVSDSGENVVITESGDNVVITESGDNVIITESSDDVVITESGDNVVITESGDNIIITETGDDVVMTEETVNENVVIAEQVVNAEEENTFITEQVVTAEEENTVVTEQVVTAEEENTLIAADNNSGTQRTEGGVIHEELKPESVSEVDVSQTQNIVEEILNADNLETVTESVVLDGLNQQEVVTTIEPMEVGTVVKNDQVEDIVRETPQESAVTSAEVSNQKIDEAVAECGKTASFIGSKEEALDHLKIIMQDLAGIPSAAENSQQPSASKTETPSNEKTEIQENVTDQQPSSMLEQVQESLVTISSEGAGVGSDKAVGAATVASESESTSNPRGSEQQTFSLTSAETAQLEQTVVANENTGTVMNEVGTSVSTMLDQLSNVDGPQNSIGSATEQHSVSFTTATQVSAENELAASLSPAANDPLSQSQAIVHGGSNTDITYETDGQAVANNTGDLVTEGEANAEDGSDKPKKSGSFSLGVPGLSFSSQNVRVAHDGTKLVQIHQSQITPDQLQALQSNPNIKVVFRHIPSGKSFTKPPKNLFNTLGKSGKAKRKSENLDDSVYNFDDDFSNSSYDSSSATPIKPREDAKYARYNPNVGIKKRRPGRPRSIPDPNVALSHSKMKSPALPTQLVLSEALCKLNKTNPNVHTLKLHISQVNLEILERMDLSPEYNIAITTKHEVSAEDQLKELAQEWADKEDTVKPVNLTDKPSLDEALASHSLLNDKLKKEQNELKNRADAAVAQLPQDSTEETTLITSSVSPVVGSPTSSSSPLIAAANHHRGPSMITVTKPESKKRGRKKNDPNPMSDIEVQMRQIEMEEAAIREREREEAEMVAAFHEQTSRSGRKRKPTRFSLDIARLTKKRPGTDDDYFFTSPSTPPKLPQKRSAAQLVLTPSISESVSSQPPRKRPRGRPSKQWLLEQQKAEEAAAVEAAISAAAAAAEIFPSTPVSAPKKELTQEEIDKLESDPTIKPRVMISLADQQSIIDHMVKLGLMPKPEPKKPKETEPGAQPAFVAPIPVEPVQQPEKPARNVGKKTKTKNKKQESNVLDLVASFFGQQEETSEMEVDIPSVDVPSSATDGTQQTEKKTGDQTETEKADEEIAECKAEDTAAKINVGENPSDILARKLNLLEAENESEDTSKPSTAEPSASKITDFIEEEGDVDNKYRLRKLLQQCSIEEIISVAIPQALNSISIGDFFLYKSGQMSKKKVSFAQMYKQLESLHGSVLKESQRYSTLLRRANKVGGDRRLDKVILMPVYNKQAADALQVNLTSIDAHIGFIQQKATSQMIAANSFRLNCKMDPPVHRLELPDLADKKQLRKKGLRAEEPPTLLYGPSKKWSQSSQRSYGSTIGRANSMATGYKSRGMFQQQQQRNKPSASGAFMTSATTVAASSLHHHSSAVVQQQEDMQEHARLQLVSRHQSTYEQQRAGAAQNQVDASMLGLTQMPGELTTTSMINSSVVSSTQASAVEASQQQASVVAAGGANVVAGGGVEQAAQLMMEDGSIMTAEEGKQLVSIGDGQYFELPEGYTLIQTDEGYIIGQPGATFVQGEDGNVYMTSGEDGTEIAATDQMLATTTANSQAEAGNAEELLQQLNQT